MTLRGTTLWLLGAGVGISAGLHLIGFGFAARTQDILIEGSAPAQFARLGNSFADLAQGAYAPKIPDSLQDISPEVQMAQVPPAPPPAAAPSDAASQPTPHTAETAAPQTQQPALPALTESATPVALAVTSPSLHTATAAGLSTPLPHLSTATSPDLEVMRGEEPVETRSPDASTVRPQTRPDRRPSKPQPPQRTAAAPSQASRGGETTARRGLDDGREDAQASTGAQSSTGTRSQTGNADAANYGGRVWRQLRQTRRVRAGARGTATVGFRIASSGAVASVYVISSAGKAQVDQAAIQHIHRAAPFPPPPRGAQTKFSYQYEGRR